MNKNLKISILLVTFSLLILLTGCEEVNKAEISALNTEIGLLTEIPEEEKVLRFNIENKDEDIILPDESLKSDFKLDEYYILTFDDNKNLVSYNHFDFEYPEARSLEVPEEVPVVEEEEIETKVNPIPPISQEIDLEGYEVFEDFETDFLNFADEVKITLYTDAEQDEDGEWMFDDGHQWTLIAEVDEQVYKLFDERIQMADLDLNIYTKDEDLHVILSQSSTAGFQVLDYTFDTESNTFIPEVAFQLEGDINKLN